MRQLGVIVPGRAHALACAGLLLIAEGELGVRELPGEADNPRIQEYQRTTTKSPLYVRDHVAWCSSAINWVVIQAGLQGTDDPAARSWLRWGVRIAEPIPGCIVVWPRPPNPWSGHVALFAGHDDRGRIIARGGNQGNEFCDAPRPAKGLLRGPLAFVVPSSEMLPPEMFS